MGVSTLLAAPSERSETLWQDARRTTPAPSAVTIYCELPGQKTVAVCPMGANHACPLPLPPGTGLNCPCPAYPRPLLRLGSAAASRIPAPNPRSLQVCDPRNQVQHAPVSSTSSPRAHHSGTTPRATHTTSDIGNHNHNGRFATVGTKARLGSGCTTAWEVRVNALIPTQPALCAVNSLPLICTCTHILTSLPKPHRQQPSTT